MQVHYDIIGNSSLSTISAIIITPKTTTISPIISSYRFIVIIHN